MADNLHSTRLTQAGFVLDIRHNDGSYCPPEQAWSWSCSGCGGKRRGYQGAIERGADQHAAKCGSR